MSRKSLSFEFDERQCAPGLILAGMDEAGRGPLAGPVVAACVIMPRDTLLDGIDDSKKLSEKKREKLYEEITAKAVAYGVGVRDNLYIDKHNILNATRAAMEDAYAALGVKPDMLLVDSVKNLALDTQYLAFDHGDALSYSIAAASIIAKVTRDRYMREQALEYPQYGFEKHKGYGTAEHIRAIESFGACPLHRSTFIKGIKPSAALTGALGENLVCDYATAMGMSIRERNYKTRYGECDIIAWDADMLCIIEVKTRSGGSVKPGEYVDVRKQKCLAAAAAEYIAAESISAPVRFDVAEVSIDGNDREIIYTKNAFEAPEGKYFA